MPKGVSSSAADQARASTGRSRSSGPAPSTCHRATTPAGSTPDTGLFVLGGHGTSVTFNADGTHTFTLGPAGTAVNVCDALARPVYCPRWRRDTRLRGSVEPRSSCGGWVRCAHAP
jgi:hypothetical protein